MDPYKAFGARPPSDSPQATGSPSIAHSGQYMGMDMHQGFGAGMGTGMAHRFEGDFGASHIPTAHMGRSHHPYFPAQQHPYMDYYQMQAHQMARADIQRPVARAMEAHMARSGYSPMELPPPTMDRQSIYEQHTGMMRQSLDRTGIDRLGMDRSGMDRTGMERYGMERYGMDRSGMERLGMDRSGMDRYGMDRLGMDRSGMMDRSGIDRLAMDHASMNMDRMGMDRYSSDRASMDRLGMGNLSMERPATDMLGMGHQAMDRHHMDTMGMDRHNMVAQSMDRSMEAPVAMERPVVERPMEAHSGMERPMEAHSGMERPMEAHSGMERPMEAHSGMERPMEAHSGMESRGMEAHSGMERHMEAHRGMERPMEAHSGMERSSIERQMDAHSNMEHPGVERAMEASHQGMERSMQAAAAGMEQSVEGHAAVDRGMEAHARMDRHGMDRQSMDRPLTEAHRNMNQHNAERHSIDSAHSLDGQVSMGMDRDTSMGMDRQMHRALDRTHMEAQPGLDRHLQAPVDRAGVASASMDQHMSLDPQTLEGTNMDPRHAMRTQASMDPQLHASIDRGTVDRPAVGMAGNLEHQTMEQRNIERQQLDLQGADKFQMDTQNRDRLGTDSQLGNQSHLDNGSMNQSQSQTIERMATEAQQSMDPTPGNGARMDSQQNQDPNGQQHSSNSDRIGEADRLEEAMHQAEQITRSAERLSMDSQATEQSAVPQMQPQPGSDVNNDGQTCAVAGRHSTESAQGAVTESRPSPGSDGKGNISSPGNVSLGQGSVRSAGLDSPAVEQRTGLSQAEGDMQRKGSVESDNSSIYNSAAGRQSAERSPTDQGNAEVPGRMDATQAAPVVTQQNQQRDEPCEQSSGPSMDMSQNHGALGQGVDMSRGMDMSGMNHMQRNYGHSGVAGHNDHMAMDRQYQSGMHPGMDRSRMAQQQFMPQHPGSPMNRPPRVETPIPQAHSGQGIPASQSNYPTSHIPPAHSGMPVPRSNMPGLNMSHQPSLSESSPSSSGTGTPPIHKADMAHNQRQQTSTLLREHLLRNANPYGREAMDPQSGSQGGSPSNLPGNNMRQRMGAHSPQESSNYPTAMGRGMPDGRSRQSHFSMDDLMKGNRMPGPGVQQGGPRQPYSQYYPRPMGSNMPFNSNQSSREGVSSPPYQLHPGLDQGRYHSTSGPAGRGPPRHPFNSNSMYPQQGQSSYPGTPQSSSAGSFLSLLTDDDSEFKSDSQAPPTTTSQLMVASQPERVYTEQHPRVTPNIAYQAPAYTGKSQETTFMANQRSPYVSPPHNVMNQAPRPSFPMQSGGYNMSGPRPDFNAYAGKQSFSPLPHPQEDPASVLGDLRRLCAPQPQQPPPLRSPPQPNVNPLSPKQPQSPRQPGPRPRVKSAKRATKKKQKMQPKLIIWKLFMEGQTTVDLPEFMEELKSRYRAAHKDHKIGPRCKTYPDMPPVPMKKKRGRKPGSPWKWNPDGTPWIRPPKPVKEPSSRKVRGRGRAKGSTSPFRVVGLETTPEAVEGHSIAMEPTPGVQSMEGTLAEGETPIRMQLNQAGILQSRPRGLQTARRTLRKPGLVGRGIIRRLSMESSEEPGPPVIRGRGRGRGLRRGRGRGLHHTLLVDKNDSESVESDTPQRIKKRRSSGYSEDDEFVPSKPAVKKQRKKVIPGEPKKKQRKLSKEGEDSGEESQKTSDHENSEGVKMEETKPDVKVKRKCVHKKAEEDAGTPESPKLTSRAARGKKAIVKGTRGGTKRQVGNNSRMSRRVVRLKGTSPGPESDSSSGPNTRIMLRRQAKSVSYADLDESYESPSPSDSENEVRRGRLKGKKPKLMRVRSGTIQYMDSEEETSEATIKADNASNSETPSPLPKTRKRGDAVEAGNKPEKIGPIRRTSNVLESEEEEEEYQPEQGRELSKELLARVMSDVEDIKTDNEEGPEKEDDDEKGGNAANIKKLGLGSGEFKHKPNITENQTRSQTKKQSMANDMSESIKSEKESQGTISGDTPESLLGETENLKEDITCENLARRTRRKNSLEKEAAGKDKKGNGHDTTKPDDDIMKKDQVAKGRQTRRGEGSDFHEKLSEPVVKDVEEKQKGKGKQAKGKQSKDIPGEKDDLKQPEGKEKDSRRNVIDEKKKESVVKQNKAKRKLPKGLEESGSENEEQLDSGPRKKVLKGKNANTGEKLVEVGKGDNIKGNKKQGKIQGGRQICEEQVIDDQGEIEKQIKDKPVRSRQAKSVVDKEIKKGGKKDEAEIKTKGKSQKGKPTKSSEEVEEEPHESDMSSPLLKVKQGKVKDEPEIVDENQEKKQNKGKSQKGKQTQNQLKEENDLKPVKGKVQKGKPVKQKQEEKDEEPLKSKIQTRRHTQSKESEEEEVEPDPDKKQGRSKALKGKQSKAKSTPEVQNTEKEGDNHDDKPVKEKIVRGKATDLPENKSDPPKTVKAQNDESILVTKDEEKKNTKGRKMEDKDNKTESEESESEEEEEPGSSRQTRSQVKQAHDADTETRKRSPRRQSPADSSASDKAAAKPVKKGQNSPDTQNPSTAKNKNDSKSSPPSKIKGEATTQPKSKNDSKIPPTTKSKEDSPSKPIPKCKAGTAVSPKSKLKEGTTISPKSKTREAPVVLPKSKSKEDAADSDKTKLKENPQISPKSKAKVEAVASPQTKDKGGSQTSPIAKSRVNLQSSPKPKTKGEDTKKLERKVVDQKDHTDLQAKDGKRNTGGKSPSEESGEVVVKRQTRAGVSVKVGEGTDISDKQKPEKELPTRVSPRARIKPDEVAINKPQGVTCANSKAGQKKSSPKALLKPVSDSSHKKAGTNKQGNVKHTEVHEPDVSTAGNELAEKNVTNDKESHNLHPLQKSGEDIAKREGKDSSNIDRSGGERNSQSNPSPKSHDIISHSVPKMEGKQKGLATFKKGEQDSINTYKKSEHDTISRTSSNIQSVHRHIKSDIPKANCSPISRQFPSITSKSVEAEGLLGNQDVDRRLLHPGYLGQDLHPTRGDCSKARDQVYKAASRSCLESQRAYDLARADDVRRDMKPQTRPSSGLSLSSLPHSTGLHPAFPTGLGMAWPSAQGQFLVPGAMSHLHSGNPLGIPPLLGSYNVPPAAHCLAQLHTSPTSKTLHSPPSSVSPSAKDKAKDIGSSRPKNTDHSDKLKSREQDNQNNIGILDLSMGGKGKGMAEEKPSPARDILQQQESKLNSKDRKDSKGSLEYNPYGKVERGLFVNTSTANVPSPLLSPEKRSKASNLLRNIARLANLGGSASKKEEVTAVSSVSVMEKSKGIKESEVVSGLSNTAQPGSSKNIATHFIPKPSTTSSNVMLNKGDSARRDSQGIFPSEEVVTNKDLNEDLKKDTSTKEEPNEIPKKDTSTKVPDEHPKDKSAKEVQNEVPKKDTSAKEVPNEHPKDKSAKEVQNEVPKKDTSVKEVPNEHPKDKSAKEVPNEHSKDVSAKEIPNEIPRQDTSEKEVPNEHLKEASVKEFPNELPKKDTSEKEVSNELPKKDTSEKEVSNELPKKDTSEKEVPNEHPKKDTSEKEVSNEPPKKDTSEKEVPNEPPKKDTSEKDVPNEHPKEASIKEVPKEVSSEGRSSKDVSSEEAATKNVLNKILPKVTAATDVHEESLSEETSANDAQKQIQLKETSASDVPTEISSNQVPTSQVVSSESPFKELSTEGDNLPKGISKNMVPKTDVCNKSPSQESEEADASQQTDAAKASPPAIASVGSNSQNKPSSVETAKGILKEDISSGKNSEDSSCVSPAQSSSKNVAIANAYIKEIPSGSMLKDNAASDKASISKFSESPSMEKCGRTSPCTNSLYKESEHHLPNPSPSMDESTTKDKMEENKLKVRVHSTTEKAESQKDSSSHFPSPGYLCEICATIFHSFDLFDAHHDQCQTYEVQYTCGLCDSEFTTPTLLWDHMPSHTINSTKDATNLMLGHGNRKQVNIGSCPTDKQCSNTTSFKLCESCGALRTKAKMRKHRCGHNKNYTCKLCGYMLPSHVLLRRHSWLQHNIHMCTKCESNFTDKRKLWKHMRSHSTGRNHFCRICWKTFPSLARLKRHKHMETGILYKCRMCMVGLADNMAQELHLNSVHGVKKLLCVYCGAVTNPASCWKHVRRVHAGIGRWKCRACHKIFSHPLLIRSHVLSHGGLKDYTCRQCDKKFSQPYPLVKHVQKVHVKLRQGQGCKGRGKIKKKTASTSKQAAALQSGNV